MRRRCRPLGAASGPGRSKQPGGRLIATARYVPQIPILPHYARQAETYDATRAASPSVLGPLRIALTGAPGPKLLDVGGGTGNYALALQAEGWEPVVVDPSEGMLARAAAKGLETVRASAEALPFGDDSADAVMLVSMLHHLPDPAAAVAEALRVLRPGGRLVLQVFTREDIAGCWAFELFPSSRPWMEAGHPTEAEVLALLPDGATARAFAYGDLEDATLAALMHHPALVLDPGWRRQTSYFERLERDDPDGLAEGLAELERRLVADDTPSPPQRDGTILAWAARR